MTATRRVLLPVAVVAAAAEVVVCRKKAHAVEGAPTTRVIRRHEIPGRFPFTFPRPK